jgi:hypothetical protein
VSPRLYIVSGIPPGNSGTGQLVEHLQTEIVRTEYPCRLTFRPRPLNIARAIIQHGRVREAGKLIWEYPARMRAFKSAMHEVMDNDALPALLLHPQTLGFSQVTELIKKRRTRTSILLLDSSFFCVSSYNHVQGENSPCLRCIGGKFDEASVHKCKPFPVKDNRAIDYIASLYREVRSGKVRLLAQNEIQADIVVKHFGCAARPAIVGVWTGDLDDAFTSGNRIDENNRTFKKCPEMGNWDVVFHGYDVPAKGVKWLEELARQMPNRRFLFPFRRGIRRRKTSNCFFVRMQWESGLREAVRQARCTVVPSLWSAPIEGALIKSIAAGKRVAIVSNDTSFGSELPKGLILTLSSDPKMAAAELERTLQTEWLPDESVKTKWLDDWLTKKQSFFDSLVHAALE